MPSSLSVDCAGVPNSSPSRVSASLERDCVASEKAKFLLSPSEDCCSCHDLDVPDHCLLLVEGRLKDVKKTYHHIPQAAEA